MATVLYPHKFSSFTLVRLPDKNTNCPSPLSGKGMWFWLRILPELLLTLPTSFLLSLSFCSSHLIEAWGDLGVHSRKVVLFFTPYWTISAAFLYARKKRKKKKTGQDTVNGDFIKETYNSLPYRLNEICLILILAKNKDFFCKKIQRD